jgi:hypothetical protein
VDESESEFGVRRTQQESQRGSVVERDGWVEGIGVRVLFERERERDCVGDRDMERVGKRVRDPSQLTRTQIRVN